MQPSSDTPSIPEPGEKSAGAVTTRLRALEGLLARAGGTADTADPPAAATVKPAPRLLVISERLVATVGVLGLLITIGIGTYASGTDFGWVGWSLFSLAIALMVVGALLAVGAGRWDALLHRQPTNAIATRDRWMTLIGAVLLICAATVEVACFQALIDGRAAQAKSTATTGTAP